MNNMYSKSQIKWSQSAIKLSTSSNNMDYVVFQNMIHDLTTTSSTNEQKTNTYKTTNSSTKSTSSTNSTNDDENLLNAILSDIQNLKHNKAYEEVLSYIQHLFENKRNLITQDIIYELADVYFLMQDYQRAFNWIQKFSKQNSKDCRSFLLSAQIYLNLGKKEDALNTIDTLFKLNIVLSTEQDYKNLDKIIEHLKKIFKTDKLLRRCPSINDYQKKRRYLLKQQKNTNFSVEHSSDRPKISSTSSTNTSITITTEKSQGAIMPNSPLHQTINHIWDLQHASNEDIKILLANNAPKISECIMTQVLAYTKKLWLFNYIANVFRLHNDLNSAIYLLRQALLLDDENDLILANLGYLLYLNQDYVNALTTLNDIKIKDFATLDLIQKCTDFNISNKK